MNLTKFLRTIGTDDSGATAVEYGLIVSLIVMAMVGALTTVANSNDSMWGRVSDASEEASGS